MSAWAGGMLRKENYRCRKPGRTLPLGGKLVEPRIGESHLLESHVLGRNPDLRNRGHCGPGFDWRFGAICRGPARRIAGSRHLGGGPNGSAVAMQPDGTGPAWRYVWLPSPHGGGRRTLHRRDDAWAFADMPYCLPFRNQLHCLLNDALIVYSPYPYGGAVMNIGNWLQKERLKVAWALLPPDKKAAIQPMIDAAHEHLRFYQ